MAAYLRKRSPYSGYQGRKTKKHTAIAHGYKSGLEDSVGANIQNITGGIPAYEPFKIPFVVPATYRTYRPDFVLPNYIVIETKGRFTIEDRQKHLLIKQQFPDLDLRFVFSRSSSPIRKGSKTTYADWCRKYGFQFNDATIPLLWHEEDCNCASKAALETILNHTVNKGCAFILS